MTLNVLHLCISAAKTGGATRAMHRLHEGLLQAGLTSRILAQFNAKGDDGTVLGVENKVAEALGYSEFRRWADTLPSHIYLNRSHQLSTAWLPDRKAKRIERLNPDIVNLHWVAGGMLRIESLRKVSKPIVWTMHDMWPFTGGCFFSNGCKHYQKGCGMCPVLGSQHEWDLSRWTFRRKENAWQAASIVAVAPSRWLADCAKESPLFQNRRVEVIPYGLNAKRYMPMDRSVVRRLFGLPENKRLVLFGAASGTGDPRKGFRYLQEALCQTAGNPEWKDTELVIFGPLSRDNILDLGRPVHYVGQLYDDISLALVYATADVFVAPSAEDNLPNTVLEALACGTPCVAFNIGGMPDMVEHKVCGYLAEPFEAEDLAAGIAWVIGDNGRHENLCKESRAKALREFTMEIQAQRYEALYRTLV